MLISSFDLSQSFNYTPYLIYKKRFKSEINSFCLWTLAADKAVQLNDNEKTDFDLVNVPISNCRRLVNK